MNLEVNEEVKRAEELKIGDKIMVASEHYLKTKSTAVGNFGKIIDIDPEEKKVLIEDSIGDRWTLDKWHCIKDPIDTMEEQEGDSEVVIEIKRFMQIIEEFVSTVETDESRKAKAMISEYLSSGDRDERILGEVTIRRAMNKYAELYEDDLKSSKDELTDELYQDAVNVLIDKSIAIGQCLAEIGIFAIMSREVDAEHGLRYTYVDEDGSIIEPEQGEKNMPKYIIDMTKRAEDGKYNEIVGRENEIDTVCEILARKEIRNPLLIGKPGCGKTAIVEEIAKRAANGEIPYLKDKHFYELRMNDLVAGTTLRGELEEKLSELMQLLEDDPNAVLFIDEIHMIVKAGSSANDKNDVANALKPYLTSEISIIGATTFDEYNVTIKDDGALARRFNTIVIEEKSKDEVKEIVDKIKGRFENFHHVEISKEMIDQIVENVASKKSENSVISRTLSAVDTICTKMKVKGIDEDAAFEKWAGEAVFETNRKNDGGRRGTVGFSVSDNRTIKATKQTMPASPVRVKAESTTISSDEKEPTTLTFDNEVSVLDFDREDIKNADIETIMAIDNIITEMANDANIEKADNVITDQIQESIEM